MADLDNVDKVILDNIEDGLIDKDYIITALLNWIPNHELVTMCQNNEIELNSDLNEW